MRDRDRAGVPLNRVSATVYIVVITIRPSPPLHPSSHLFNHILSRSSYLSIDYPLLLPFPISSFAISSLQFRIYRPSLLSSPPLPPLDTNTNTSFPHGRSMASHYYRNPTRMMIIINRAANPPFGWFAFSKLAANTFEAFSELLLFLAQAKILCEKRLAQKSKKYRLPRLHVVERSHLLISDYSSVLDSPPYRNHPLVAPLPVSTTS